MTAPNEDRHPLSEFLSTVFPSLADREIDELCRVSMRTQYGEDELIAQEGSYASGVYIVQSGLLCIGKYSSRGRNRRRLRFLGVGEMFGLEAVFLERKAVNVQFAHTVMESSVVFFERSNILAFSKDHPMLFRDLCRWLAREVIMLEFKLTRQTVESMDRNLAMLLVALGNKYGVRKQSGLTLELPISRQTMAEMLGVSVETLMRGLKRFRELGFLGQEHGKISLLNMDGLAERARIDDSYLSIMEETL
jgi:CRP/FNR family transcriptional regulator